MSTKNTRANVAEQTIQRSLLRRHPDLSDGALTFLMDAARQTIEFQSHVEVGEALDVTGLVESVKRSDAGQLVFASEVEESAAPDHVSATKDMTPQQRINYARKHGLS